MSTENLSLREQKRRATLLAIEDHATRLVVDRGYDKVTVDDICAEVGISKRTFFNYFDSKENAVIGVPPRDPSDEVRQEFLNEVHEDYMSAIIDLILTMVDPSMMDQDIKVRREILKRRKMIRKNQPRLTYERDARFWDTAQSIRAIIAEYLTKHPEQQRLDGSIDSEAGVASMLAFTATKIGFFTWAHAPSDSEHTLHVTCHEALKNLRTVAQGA